MFNKESKDIRFRRTSTPDFVCTFINMRLPLFTHLLVALSVISLSMPDSNNISSTTARTARLHYFGNHYRTNKYHTRNHTRNHHNYHHPFN
ncbi:hypothetical protein DNTS_013508, partial [Danionella cerebrum]